MSEFKDLMLDIETMSLHPNNALILSIGLIEFDPTADDHVRFGESIVIRPDLSEQLLLGRHVDPKTQAFWAAQPKAAQDDWREGMKMGLSEVVDQIEAFTFDTARLWANGIVFDIGNVASLIRQVGRTEPWHYQAPRDMRTFCRELPQRRVAPIGDALDIEGVPHAALYDCKAQAIRVWQHWPQQ